MATPGTRSAPGSEALPAGGSPTVPGSGGPRSAYLAPDVPELAELVDAAEEALLAVAGEDPDDDAQGGAVDGLVDPGWWGWLGLAAMGAAAFPVRPTRSPTHRERVHREALVGLRRLRRALAPALHADPDDGRPWWWSPDLRRLVAFRVVVVDRNALDGLAVVAAEHPALSCLLAVLVGVDEPDAAALEVAGRALVGTEVLLDVPTHHAYRRVAARLLAALHEVHEQGGRPDLDTTSRDRRTSS